MDWFTSVNKLGKGYISTPPNKVWTGVWASLHSWSVLKRFWSKLLPQILTDLWYIVNINCTCCLLNCRTAWFKLCCYMPFGDIFNTFSDVFRLFFLTERWWSPVSKVYIFNSAFINRYTFLKSQTLIRNVIEGRKNLFIHSSWQADLLAGRVTNLKAIRIVLIVCFLGVFLVSRTSECFDIFSVLFFFKSVKR